MAVKRPRVRYLRGIWMKPKDGAMLTKARRRKGYTQRDLAGLAKCSQAAISALETGAMSGCSYDLARVIAKWLDRDVEELFVSHESTRVHRVTNAAGSTRQPATSEAA